MSKENLLFSIQHDIRGEQPLRAFLANTHDRSSGDLRSRSASELLLTQKTELPCHHDGLLKEYPEQLHNIFGFSRIKFFSFFLYMVNAVCYIFLESTTRKAYMSDLFRFGVSLDKALLDKFDRYIRERNYSNRSEAFRDLIRQELIKEGVG